MSTNGRRQSKALIDPISPGIDKPYPVYGGLFRGEAIMLLRRFYMQENTKGVILQHVGVKTCTNSREISTRAKA